MNCWQSFKESVILFLVLYVIKNKMRVFFRIIFAIIFVVFCSRCGTKLSFEAHIKIYDTLLTASGILFGVFGLWVSVLYPSILEKSLNESGKIENPQNISLKANQLLEPMFISLLLFLIMIFVEFIAPFIKALDVSFDTRKLLKCISSGTASIIFIILIYSIIGAMDQTEAFQSLVAKNAVLSDMKKRFMSGFCRNKDGKA